MTTKTIKTILFASLMVAMILPFSGIMMAEAAPNENVNNKAIEDYNKHASNGEIILPGGFGWVHPSELKYIDSDKSIDENAKNGIDRKFMVEKDGKTILNISAMKDDTNLNKLDPSVNYPALSTYNQVALKHETNSMTYFNGFWVVPDAPVSFSGGTIYTFNAMQPWDQVILQPILQYGNTGVCGDLGANWAMVPIIYAEWGTIAIGDCTIVNEGDLIRGTIVRDSSYVWTVSMEDYNIPGSSDSVQVIYYGDMSDSLVALETYG
ncbi:MAG: hypothetical protein O6761_06310, partial [Thaumarchaeota archaeon]|nr:hypothetical protein [Nitrososphaerota archaeon]